ncbi:MAG: glycoside hydrolase family 2 protein [Chloroflexota bacterium]
MKLIPLNGAWTVQKLGDDDVIPATVPGCVHTDLFTAGRIPDPTHGTHAQAMLWIGETDWVYKRTFEVERSFLRLRRVILRCEGLDTLATIRINGIEVGKSANMFHAHEFNIKKALRRGENTIEIIFSAPLIYLRQMDAENSALKKGRLHRDIKQIHPSGWLRKQTTHFGWDNALPLPTVGIWRDIAIFGVEDTRITDIRIQTEARDSYTNVSVRLTLSPRPKEPVTAVVSLARDGLTVMANKRVTFDGETTSLDFIIRAPAKWYPHDMGAQPTYEVLIGVFDRDLNQLDYDKRTFGLCDFTLHKVADSEKIDYFACNGEVMNVKAALWVPPSPYPGQTTKAQYRQLLQDAKDAHINMLRVWGGGVYESDYFYQLCDEMGIAVWQDVMGLADRLPEDDDFLTNMSDEISVVGARLRHHPCLALWSVPTGHFSSSEPKTTILTRLLANDLWKVYGGAVERFFHNDLPFNRYDISLPHPRTLSAVKANVADGDNPDDMRTMAHDEVEAIAFHDQIAQLEIITGGLQARRHPNSQTEESARHHFFGHTHIIGYLNDNWAMRTTASIDSGGRWKAAHYGMKRLFAPQLVSGVVSEDKDTVDIYVSHHGRHPLVGDVAWTLTTATGAILAEGVYGFSVGARSSEVVQTVSLKDYRQQYEDNDLLLWLQCKRDATVLSDAVVMLVDTVELALQEPTISIKAREQGGDTYEVQLSTHVVAMYVWLDAPDVRFSDNFFHMRPSVPYSVTVTAPAIARLQVRSLYDLRS